MAAFTYPGVYIEEIPSGVSPITGVATSIAAFVGWADQGPTNQAVLVQSWSDFQTQYGGLDSRSYLGYAVNQFFGNGGQQAYIVRVVWDGTLPAAPGTALAPCATSMAAGVGIATSAIKATVNGISASGIVTVGSAVLESISITPGSPPWIPVGQTQQFTATGNYSDGTTKNLTSSVTWSPGATAAIATVSPGGLAKGLTAGTAIITATSGVVSVSVELTVSTATLSSIAVTPAAPSIAAGLTQQFTATGTYSDTSTQDLTAAAAWASSNTGAATIVANSGLATGVAAGAANITAAWGGVTGTTALTVVAATLVSIALTPGNPTIQTTDAPLQLTATATNSDNSTDALTGAHEPGWVSSNTAVATVDATGLVKPLAAGTTVITATSGTISGYTTVTVTAASIVSIAITPASPSVASGLKLQLAATATYSDGTTQDVTDAATWASSDLTAAKVTASGGLATGVGAGKSANITAAWDGKTGSATLAVTAAVLESLAVTPATAAIPSAGTQQFTATGTFSDGSTQNLTGSAMWVASAPTIAGVNSTGLATAATGGDTLTLFASNPGAWGNNIQVSVVLQAANPSRFSLQVLDGTTGRVLENFANLSTLSTDPQYVVTVIDNDSNYITFVNPATGAAVVPVGPPAATGTPVSLAGGADGSPLVPASDGNFETALAPNPNATFAYGVHLLDRVDIFNLLCVPGETDQPTIQDLQEYCWYKRAFYIVDCPQTVTTAGLTNSGPVGTVLGGGAPTPGLLSGQYSINSAYYYPWVQAPDPLFGNRSKLFPPCGFVAGIYAATDGSRGVWKAPAGIDAGLTGVTGLQYVLTDLENGSLNPQAINCLRQFRVYGDVVWGARTLQGNDQAGSQWKYIPIKRLALFLESSLYDGTQWVVFEPNAEPLWGQIRLNVGAFMQGLFLQGAFQGTTPQQAYFVKCDSENNPQASIDLGIVNILVGFAPLYPAEFVVIQIQQMAGQGLS
jgi:phage tail sheath protein FI